QLQAYYRHQTGRRIAPNLSYLAAPGHHLLATADGPLDLLGTVSGDRGYEELVPHTDEKPIALGLNVRLPHLATIIQLKEEVGRDKDKAVLPILRQTLEERNKGG